jgi:hypothetical protein
VITVLARLLGEFDSRKQMSIAVRHPIIQTPPLSPRASAEFRIPRLRC